jgi:hypothetical protein
MNEPTKENPKASKRSKRRPPMEPLGWDEIVSQPGMGGYLSFLNGPVPLPHLQGPAAALAPDPGVVSHPEPTSTPEALIVSGASQTAQIEAIPDLTTAPGVVPRSGIDSDMRGHSTPQIAPNPVVASSPRIDIAPEVISIPVPVADTGFTPSSQATTPEVVSTPAVPAQRLRIRRCAATHDGHSLGEEVLYQALWKAAHPESSETRTIVIGWRGMSQLCRMTPKNCKINTQRLIRKLALEVLSPYNTPESIGTTYRIYSDQAILQRRRDAGLEWVVRSRGVEFVDPATGVSILPICAPTYQSEPPLI